MSQSKKKKVKKPKFPRCILPPNKVKPSKKVYDRKKLRKEEKKNMNKVYILERVTERDSVITPPIHFSMHDCIKFMRRDKFPREMLWCWSVTIAYSEQSVSEPRIFFDWNGKFIFRKDDNTEHVTIIFNGEEFLPIKLKLRARR